MKNIFLSTITAALLLFTSNTSDQATTSIGTPAEGVLDGKKISYNLFAEFSMLEVEFHKNDQFKNKNISTYILGLTSTLPLSKNFDLRGSVGMTEGFSYNFATADIALKLSENFSLHYGIGSYFINDDRWVTNGIDGNEPSDIDFGMNFGINLQLTKSLGINMKYNLIEEKDDYEVGSMSIGGLSFGVTVK